MDRGCKNCTNCKAPWGKFDICDSGVCSINISDTTCSIYCIYTYNTIFNHGPVPTSLWAAEANSGNDIWTVEKDLIQHCVIKQLRMLSFLSRDSTCTPFKQKAWRDKTTKFKTLKGHGTILLSVWSKPCRENFFVGIPGKFMTDLVKQHNLKYSVILFTLQEILYC